MERYSEPFPERARTRADEIPAPFVLNVAGIRLPPISGDRTRLAGERRDQ